MPSKVVVHFSNRVLLRGTVEDLTPTKDSFTLIESGTNKKHLVPINKNLKAVFFVKSFTGSPNPVRKKGFHLTHAFGSKVVVKFHDGEIFYGYSEDYTPYTAGFFAIPAFPESNNIKVFIPKTSVLEIIIGQDIDKSKYGKGQQKFLKKIVPKVVHVTLQVSVGDFLLEGAIIKIVETGETLQIKKGESGVVASLKPGKYTLEVTYEDHKITRTIRADTDKRFYRLDLQKTA